MNYLIHFLTFITTFTVQTPEQPALQLEVPPELPAFILGEGHIPDYYLTAFLQRRNMVLKPDFVSELARLYVEEAAAEGVNHDIAFVQMCLETGFLHFGNLVKPDMNNFAGLGAINASQPGEHFPDPRTGVRAQIQHLKGYATEDPLVQALVDPRYKWVRKGSAPTIAGLAGTWASDPRYAAKITGLVEQLYRFSSGE
ncbi:lipoprotein [Spirochaetia bacterium]|nr:lipoprotein [Spirochaetia bacterium]